MLTSALASSIRDEITKSESLLYNNDSTYNFSSLSDFKSWGASIAGQYVSISVEILDLIFVIGNSGASPVITSGASRIEGTISSENTFCIIQATSTKVTAWGGASNRGFTAKYCILNKS